MLELGKNALKIGSGATPRGGKSSYLDHGPYSLVRSQNVYNHGFESDGLAFISEDQARKLSNVELLESDVLINITGDSVARVCLVDPSVLPARVNQHVAILRPDPSAIDPLFLRYFLVKPSSQSLLLALASAGATRNALTKSMLESLEIPDLDVDLQRSIGHFLKSLDDKIELNRRMNETLEEIARALFRDWFVDFGPTRRQIEGATDPAAIMGHAFPPEKAATLAPLFPAKLADDGLPNGWVEGKLEDFGTIKNGFAFKSKDWRDDGIPVIKIKNVKPRLVSLDGAGFIDPELAIERKRFRLGASDILVGMTGYVGEVGRVPDVDPLPMLNQRVGHIVAEYREGFSPFLFACTRQKEFKQHAVARSHGSAQANVSAKDLGLFGVAKPCSETVGAFDEVALPLFERMQVADTENQTLAALRDLLLPKLMSGEICLKDAVATV